NLALTLFHRVGRRRIKWEGIFIAGKARTINFRFVISSKKPPCLAGWHDLNRLEVVFEESARAVTVEIPSRHRALAHLEQGATQRARRHKSAGPIDDGNATLQKRVKGSFLIVVLPAFKRGKTHRLCLRMTQMNAGRRGRGRGRKCGGYEEPKTESNVYP